MAHITAYNKSFLSIQSFLNYKHEQKTGEEIYAEIQQQEKKRVQNTKKNNSTFIKKILG